MSVGDRNRTCEGTKPVDFLIFALFGKASFSKERFFESTPFGRSGTPTIKKLIFILI